MSANTTAEKLTEKFLLIAKENAPVRDIVDKKGRPLPRAVGKPGTNMYSPYPGNLKNNGIYRIPNGIRFDYDKGGYIGYANIRSRNKHYIEKTINDFCNYCVQLGARVTR